MRHLLLASAAATALVASLAVSGAQQAPSSAREQPAATESTRQAPSPRDADGNRQQGDPAVRQEQRQPGARVQQDRRQQTPAADSRQSPGQAADRPTGQQRNQPRRDEAREERKDRVDRDRNRGVTRERAADDRGRDRSRDRRTTSGQSREDRTIDNTRQRGDVSRSDTERTRRGQAQQRRDEPARRGSLSLSDEQRTRISAGLSDRIERMNVRPLSRSRISVSVGAIVPRSVNLYPVPRDIVEIYPEFRSHRFVLVEDEIVIIEPGSYRIVATLPLHDERADSYTTGTAAAGSRIRLTQDDRRVIRTVVMREPSCRLEQRVDFFIIPLPRTVEICEFPEEVVSEVPEIRSYRYIVRGDEIVLVDPDERRVVEVID